MRRSDTGARPDYQTGFGAQRQPQVERLGGDDQFEGQDPLDVRDDGHGVAGRDRSHRDVVFLIRRGRDRVGAGRVGQHLVLRRQRRGRVLEQHHARLQPAAGRKERRQAAVQARVHQQRDPPFRDRAELRDRQLGEVERDRDRLAVEVAATDDQPAAGGEGVGVGSATVGEDERVVRGGVQLYVEDAAQILQRVADGAVDLRNAAQRVGILDLVGGGVVARHQRRVAQQPAQLRGHRDLARVRPGQLVGGRVGDVGAEQRLAAHCRGHARGPAQAVGVRRHQGPDAGHHLRPVEKGQPLLGLQDQWLEAGRVEGSRPPERRARRPRLRRGR